MKIDVVHAVNIAVCSPNKDLHGAIDSLQLQKVLAHLTLEIPVFGPLQTDPVTQNETQIITL